MNKLQKILLFSVVLCGSLMNVLAQSPSNIVRKDLSQAEIDRIVKNFTGKEAEFREALKNYVFNRSAIVQTVGMGGQITGEFRRDSFMTFNSDGARFEKVLFAPIETITDVRITVQDIEDLGGVNAFALEPRVVNLYSFNYIGKEKIDELDLYVFDVAPKVMPDPKKTDLRLFQGRIWVDDRDLQIVKSKGKGVPETKDNKYPIVETWRENIDGKYWFPAYAAASGSDGEIIFDSGQVAKLKLRIKYTNYREGKSDVKIIEEVPEETTKPKPSPTPKKP